MSDPSDDKMLDEYLEGRSPLSRHYRELDDVKVPAHLDELVLRQAREAIAPSQPGIADAQAGLRRRRRRLMRWAIPATLAASVVVVVSVVIESGTQHAPVATYAPPAAPSVVELPKVVAPNAPQVAQTQPAPAPADNRALLPSEKRAQKASAQRAEKAAVAQVVPPPSIAIAPPPSSGVTATRQAKPASPASIEQQEAHREANPQDWLQYIRELRKNGETEKADDEWKRFRDAYPDFAVAATDSARPPQH